MFTKITILGGGAMGTALAQILSLKMHLVKIWCYEPDVAQEINRKHKNTRFLPDIVLKPGISATTDIKEASKDADFILVAIPSAFVLDTMKKILTLPNIMEGESHIGILTKGFIQTPKGVRLILESLEDYLPGSYKGNLVYISGPSHAEELVRGMLTGLICASVNAKESILFRNLISGRSLVAFSSFDVIGVQVCAALKNVIAIGFGMADALKEESSLLGDNAESLLLAAGLNEIQRVGMAMGSTYPETFTSIAGVGDLDVTCRSKYGRNRRFGREIILNDALKPFKNIEDLLANINSLGYLPEGAFAAKYMTDLAKKYTLRLPISASIYRILDSEADPRREVQNLVRGLMRTGREERNGK
ncbi:MAG: NAD(P)-dependent glycerol-3-phosphate dehydrogenase [Spirochaetaceae bacterium]|nr:MAG: NAD(P)-dependent glycerol-3-phosphate dehydrogenase [Spirochaetaceae bacterium]